MQTALHRLVENPFALIFPLALFLSIVFAGLILRRVLFAFLHRWAESSDSHLDQLLTGTLRGPILMWSVILGLHASSLAADIPAPYRRYIHPTIEALWAISITVALSRLAGNAVRFYGGKVRGANSVTSLTQKLAQLLVVALGLIWLLKVVFNMSLSPVVTAFGVSGLAVALGLQDTLSNLFAGFYISISGLVRLGDYIKLSSSEEGYIADITWRCTTMRTLANNLVVIPNNKLAQSIYTNYYLPEPRMGMSISISVGYDSDIDRVEAILLEETVAAATEIEGLIADPPPAIRFNPGPADWALIYQVNFNVAQFADQYKVQSTLRKLLFKRLLSEKISMPFPTRTIQLEDKRTP